MPDGFERIRRPHASADTSIHPQPPAGISRSSGASGPIVRSGRHNGAVKTQNPCKSQRKTEARRAAVCRAREERRPRPVFTGAKRHPVAARRCADKPAAGFSAVRPKARGAKRFRFHKIFAPAKIRAASQTAAERQPYKEAAHPTARRFIQSARSATLSCGERRKRFAQRRENNRSVSPLAGRTAEAFCTSAGGQKSALRADDWRFSAAQPPLLLCPPAALPPPIRRSLPDLACRRPLPAAEQPSPADGPSLRAHSPSPRQTTRAVLAPRTGYEKAVCAAEPLGLYAGAAHPNRRRTLPAVRAAQARAGGRL